MSAVLERDAGLPTAGEGEIVGQVNDDAGVQAMIVRIDGTSRRPDGGTYHTTWSLGDGRRAEESNDAIASADWREIAPAVRISLEPRRF